MNMSLSKMETNPWDRYAPFQRWLFLAILMLIGISAAVDKAVLPILFQPIKAEFGLSDRMLGLLGGAPFAVCFALSSIPLARLADRRGRKPILIAALIGWSVMSVACGLAPTLLLLFLTRMGVGLAEGGANPPSHALLVDYFPPRQRAFAFALFTATASIGYMLASGIGGWMAQHYGWRAVFLVTGVSAIPIVVLAMACLRERRSVPTPQPARPVSATRTDLKALWGKASFRLLLAAMLFFAIYPYGLISFTPTYMVRLFGMSLAEAGPLFGLSVALGQLAGSVGGGLLADRLQARDERWLLWVPALSVLVSFPIAVAAFSVNDATMFLILGCLGIAAASAAVPPAFAAVQHVCGGRSRATASAVAVIVLHAVGMALAPLFIGFLSDAYAGATGSASVRYGILSVTPLLLASAGAFWRAAHFLHRDREP